MNIECKLFSGRLHSPYFIFLKVVGPFSERALLAMLGMDDFVTCQTSADFRRARLYLTEDDTWFHIADDWGYSLWHRGTEHLVDVLHARMPSVPIFACWVGDSDSSFGFSYYDSGRLLRKYIADDPHYDKNRRIITEDFGSPLPAESQFPEFTDEQDYVLSIASSLGVKINHRLESIRCYQSPVDIR